MALVTEAPSKPFPTAASASCRSPRPISRRSSASASSSRSPPSANSADRRSRRRGPVRVQAPTAIQGPTVSPELPTVTSASDSGCCALTPRRRWPQPRPATSSASTPTIAASTSRCSPSASDPGPRRSVCACAISPASEAAPRSPGHPSRPSRSPRRRSSSTSSTSSRPEQATRWPSSSPATSTSSNAPRLSCLRRPSPLAAGGEADGGKGQREGSDGYFPAPIGMVSGSMSGFSSCVFSSSTASSCELTVGNDPSSGRCADSFMKHTAMRAMTEKNMM